jgi:hypothetical protein
MFEAKRIDPELLRLYRSQHSETIEVISTKRPLLLVFLRHFG